MEQERNLVKLHEYAQIKNKFYKDMEMGESNRNFTNSLSNHKMSDLVELKSEDSSLVR